MHEICSTCRQPIKGTIYAENGKYYGNCCIEKHYKDLDKAERAKIEPQRMRKG